MDKPLKLEHAKIIAKDYVQRINENLSEIIGIAKSLQKNVKADQDIITNLDLLESTLAELKTLFTESGIEIDKETIQVIDLSDYINQLNQKVIELNNQITEWEAQLEGLV